LNLTEWQYYADKFNDAAGNLRNTWKLISKMLNNKLMHDTIKELNVGGINTTDKQLMANELNDYFANIGLTLASKIKPEAVKHSQYLRKNYPNSPAMTETTESEIIAIVNDFENKTSSGADEIPVNLVKATFKYRFKPLMCIINNSILTGSFPDILKIAKICPIFKTGNKTDLENYRPISLLSTFSKIFEKVIHKRLTLYLEKNVILYTRAIRLQKKSFYLHGAPRHVQPY
jgi:hypothetical protein